MTAWPLTVDLHYFFYHKSHVMQSSCAEIHQSSESPMRGILSIHTVVTWGLRKLRLSLLASISTSRIVISRRLSHQALRRHDEWHKIASWAAMDADSLVEYCISYRDTGSGRNANTGAFRNDMILRNESMCIHDQQKKSNVPHIKPKPKEGRFSSFSWAPFQSKHALQA